MNIAVLTLTRDRLDYTQHCFAKLREFAGCGYDHWVLDQGSTDGTREWLEEEYTSIRVWSDENIGIGHGMNDLLRRIESPKVPDYDVIVKFDNDCELTQPNTLHDVAQLALDGGCILSPRILGLNNPPAITGELRVGDETILDIPQIGGIFMAVPAWVYDEFRYSMWGHDDVELCAWFRQHGGTCGYVKRLEAWHYETTDGQNERYPDYLARKVEELPAYGLRLG